MTYGAYSSIYGGPSPITINHNLNTTHSKDVVDDLISQKSSKVELHHKKPLNKILLPFPSNSYKKTSNAHASIILANPYYHTANKIIPPHKHPTTIDIHIITRNTSHISSSLPGILDLIQTIQEKPTKTSKLPSSRK